MHSLSLSYSIARAFQEEIIPFHLEFYLGTRKGDEDEDEGFEGFDEEDDEDGEGEDDDDDEEDEAPQRRGKGGKGGKSRGGNRMTYIISVC